MIAKVKGYPFKVVVPENVSPERVNCSGSLAPRSSIRLRLEGSNGAMRRAQALATEHPDWWFPYQYGNPANPQAHYEAPGPRSGGTVLRSPISWPASARPGTLIGVGTGF